MADVITSYLEKKTKTDLQFSEPEPEKGSNEVELTEAVVGEVVGLLLQRKSHRDIKRAVKLPNPKAGGALTLSLSYGQIKEIEAGLRSRQVELHAAEIAKEKTKGTPAEEVLG